MLRTKLGSCASLLYHWIQSHSYTNQRLKSNFDLDNFQAWTGEFMENKASYEQIRAALSQLQNFGLIAIEGNEIILINKIDRPKPQIQSLPTVILRGRANNPWLWGAVLAISFLGLGTASILLSNKISQQAGHKTVVNNPYQVLGEKW